MHPNAAPFARKARAIGIANPVRTCVYFLDSVGASVRGDLRGAINPRGTLDEDISEKRSCGQPRCSKAIKSCCGRSRAILAL